MNTYIWNPVFNKVMKLKRAYVSSAETGNIGSIYDPAGFKTCIDRWISATNDPFWTDVRPFLIIKQYKNVILLKYAKLCLLEKTAEEHGITTSDELWEHWDHFLTYCRSITIDVELEMIVTAPFDKFFNIGELQSTSWDIVKEQMAQAWSIEFSNKLDGSICIARYVEEYQHFVITSSGALNEEEGTATVLRDIKKMFFSPENESLRMLVEDSDNYTCMFEYISLDNPIVVHYKKEQEGLYLIGMRNVYTGEILSYSDLSLLAQEYSIKVTSVFDSTLDDIMQLVRTKKADEMEGFVINIDGQLYKLKVDDYVRIHKILSKLSAPNLVLRAIADDTYDDLLSKLPEVFRPEVGKIAKIIFNWVETKSALTSKYFEAAPKEDKKTFMIWVSENVPNDIQGHVRNLYLGKLNNFLKRARGSNNYQYMRMKQIDPNYMDKIGNLNIGE